MMLSHTSISPPIFSSSSSSSSSSYSSLSPSTLYRKKPSLLSPNNPFSLRNFIVRRRRRRTSGNSFITCLGIGPQELAEIAHNKVFVAAIASAAIGQIVKPFASAFLYGKDLDLKASIRSGGFPSTHSSSVIATATSLGIERGFSDSIFGMSVVFACIIAYDAQAVRQEAGKHATVLNSMYKNKKHPVDSVNNSESLAPLLTMSRKGEKEERSSMRKETNYSPSTSSYLRSDNSSERSSLLSSNLENESYHSLFPLKESVGHTRLEVIAGCLLGFLSSLAVHSVM